MIKNKLWFKAKCYGWGWYPSTWEGALVIILWMILFIFSIKTLDHEWLKNIIVSTILVIILLWICYKKGEKPGWRWGK